MRLAWILVVASLTGCAVKSVKTTSVTYSTPGVPPTVPPPPMPDTTIPVPTMDPGAQLPPSEGGFEWPIAHQPSERPRVVSGFGTRKYTNAQGEQTELHEGIDIAVPSGSAVRAAREGKVVFAGFSKMYASRTKKDDRYQLIILLHPDGKSTRYVHLSQLRVKPGQAVTSKQVIGITSDSDEAIVPVLHFEVRTKDGKAKDPMTFLVSPS